MEKVLIAYVTKTGTTKKAVEIISEVLETNNYYTTTIPISDVQETTGYDAVIVGGPINGMQWHPDATAFIRTNSESFEEKDVSYFALAYVYSIGSKFWKKQIDKAFNVSAKVIKPKITGIFGGKIDKEFSTIARLIFGIKKESPTDIQDFDKIRDWASEWVKLHS